MDSSAISPKDGYGTFSTSTSTARPTDSQQAAHIRSERGKVIAGIVGGLGGLLVLCILICCAVAIVRRRNVAKDHAKQRKMQDSAPRLDSLDKYEYNVREQQIPKSWPRSPYPLKSPQYTMRPLPREPRPAPDLPETEPWTGNRLHHEVPSSYSPFPSQPLEAKRHGDLPKRPPTPPFPRKTASNPFQASPR